MDSRVRGNDGVADKRQGVRAWIPAYAGMTGYATCIAAYAGMTGCGDDGVGVIPGHDRGSMAYWFGPLQRAISQPAKAQGEQV